MIKTLKIGKKLGLLVLITTFVLASGPANAFSLSSLFHHNAPIAGQVDINSEIKAFTAQNSNLDPKVLRLALTAYNNAKTEAENKRYFTIVDYSRPSDEPRLWVLDMVKRKVRFETRVSHGKKSGLKNSTEFSNKNGSNKSSIGLYETANTYVGKHGYALRLKGLEKNYNDHAYQRAIVMHGAWYATKDFAKTNGYLGRSLGCFAISQNVLRPIVKLIKDGSLIFAYYPDKQWLNGSEYL